MCKITLSLTISSHYGQNSKIAKCLFIDDYMTKAIQENDFLTWRKLHTFGEMPIEYEKQTVLSFMVNIPRLPNVYL